MSGRLRFNVRVITLEWALDTDNSFTKSFTGTCTPKM